MNDRFNRLAKKLKRKNRQAGEEIFDSFAPQFFRFFLVRTSSRETAQDLTQDVFLKAFDKIRTFNEKLGSFSGWIWQIAKNTVKDYYRKKKPVALSDAALRVKENDDFLTTSSALANKTKILEVMDLLKDFSETEQEIFSLHYLSDLPYRAISKMLGKSESSLRVLVHRINKKLRNALK